MNGSPPFSMVKGGGGFILIEWGDLLVMVCYLVPSLPMVDYEERLERMGECFRRHTCGERGL